eukprot:CAMPEP_0116996154 /NCGR_PEP_ID=MMETSP0472-20121206/65_1 /TAXON_ID=693140 ORGANISM="Tiarina fusus, Strain LIS" /NCGR_SAMPLE_ID=MMETSP0472 /ASSEMBLY_ACC=CAM_ASM_000603 /LENGTH=746 /DNA_ID=CAMNT_0004694701 /DNA_START=278 /DNA_END=2518 /DNA_ORIENTATION=-
MSHGACVESVKELHHYINCTLKSTRGGKEPASCKMAAAFFQEDERLHSKNQVFRPTKGRGIGLHYRILRDRSTMAPFIPLVTNASNTSGKSNKRIEGDVTGVVVCVGIAGLPSAYVMSSLHYSLAQRMNDSIDILAQNKACSPSAARALFATLLLTDDEDRLTNSMAEAASRIIVSQDDDLAGEKGGRGLLGKKRSQEAVAHDNDTVESNINSADQARIMVERLAVLSVAENDTIFRKFEGREKAGDKSTKTRRRKGGRDADLDGFDFKGEQRSTRKDLAHAASSVSDTASVKSSGTSKVQLRQPKKDTTSRSLGKQRTTSVPALLASSKDSGARSRRQSVDHAPRANRNRRASAMGASSAGDWSFDGANGGSFHPESSKPSRNFESDSIASNKISAGSVGSRGSRNQPQNNFDPFASNSNSVGDATASTTSETTYSTRKSKPAQDDDHESAMDSHFGGNGFDDQSTDMGMQKQRSSRSLFDTGSEGGPRVQVNVALNEDLTCFYKLSKMSSCSVEGVVQVQVKSNTQQGVPFFLLIKDPSKHIQSIQENKKFADNMAEALMQEPPGARPDYKFTVSVPKADNYFPVMRYKCGNELRPVPIRVQTRVRLEESHWRVALQISSNPHNEDNLTDLTIIMGVPPVVKGESLTTSPPGGVWNASKRSVIWCVSELGGGEKFQLQARFEIDPDAPSAPDEKPKFPVLVRCQCMYAQLSDVEVEVRDIPEVFPAEVKMKLARRFRLSHRERP